LPAAHQRVRPFLPDLISRPLADGQIVEQGLGETVPDIEETVATIEEPIAGVLWNRSLAIASLL
jgi:hypothetical protein